MENSQEGNFIGCQMSCLNSLLGQEEIVEPQPFIKRIKRTFAKPWNTKVKNWLRKGYNSLIKIFPSIKTNKQQSVSVDTSPVDFDLKPGDWVRVRSREEIEPLLNPWSELKGCAFLDSMWEYCGTTQRVLQVVERFLDERDYKVKRARGVVMLEDMFCEGTPVFGRCDRRCFLFWRVEWLEKIQAPQ